MTTELTNIRIWTSDLTTPHKVGSQDENYLTFIIRTAIFISLESSQCRDLNTPPHTEHGHMWMAQYQHPLMPRNIHLGHRQKWVGHITEI